MRLSLLQGRLLIGAYRATLASRTAGPVPASSVATAAVRHDAEGRNARAADAAAGFGVAPDDAAAVVVAHDPAAWLDRTLDRADHVSVSRALRSLQAKGLIVLRPRVEGGARRFAVGSVALTPAGNDLAKRITAGALPAKNGTTAGALPVAKL